MAEKAGIVAVTKVTRKALIEDIYSLISSSLGIESINGAGFTTRRTRRSPRAANVCGAALKEA